MPRRVETVVVPQSYGRDAGKHFEITETDAVTAEKWFWRLVIALKGTSGQIPEEIASYGMAAMAVIAVRSMNTFLAADVDWLKLAPLLDELLACVQRVRDTKTNDRATGRPLATPIVPPDDIEEIKTVVWLRSEVVRIHTNFSLADGLLTLVSAISRPTETSSTT